MMTPYTFRHRTIGCAASPPTWACYKQIQGDEEDWEDEDSFSESRLEGEDGDGDSGAEEGGAEGVIRPHPDPAKGQVDLVPPPPKRQTHSKKQKKPHRERVYALRPVLTIQRSQGFDLFIPPYIKDRYVASTSPPNGGFISTSVSSTNSMLTEYESVEVVEIRVHIIP
ncbi:hypothetical protein K438DRAFT_1988228 [Mycena galopus ATCC 62051]|nr:hypothetical protein K438DRAFT_1988228 [Mycena galopus ATCC 62051]